MAGRRLGSVRVRTTVAAVLIVGAGLGLASAALVVATRRSLTEDIRDSAGLYARELTRQLDAGAPPGSLPTGDNEEQLVQVLAGDGTVLLASPVLANRPALARLDPGESANLGKPTGDDRFMAVAAASSDGRYTVLVARSSDVVTESTRVVVGSLTLGLPVLVLLVGATTWFIVGRALRPVDAIRREVDEVSAAQLHRRVPAPGGDDEIAHLANTMNRMLDRLEQSQDRLRRFVSDASHELRSPVATIRQHSEVALAHPDRTTVPELAETVLAEDLRIQRLVEDLLLLASSDERAPAAQRPVDLDDLVFAEAARLRQSTSLRVDTASVSAGRVRGEAGALGRVLRNLGDNAARHAAGTVAFSLTSVNGQVVGVVEDDGPGIPEAERVRVFDRFVRLDEARARDDGGAGLGLAIVAQLVAAHGGTVSITRSALGGARVELRLPLLDS
ncbi:HAMP domain-containing sensor histidine kinase [Sporichthya sp.]|uniref:sensor histidine kinase n=1 Tax=Sporichthya sp. TaxID=65475 RepID=UPI0017F23CA6|nr:HAMP domain-containing sensor histidine kinase [Sporichthya sp.]MBA3743044.1 HAMP domain-containing histidine kinase [Sporichthya sp.]